MSGVAGRLRRLDRAAEDGTLWRRLAPLLGALAGAVVGAVVGFSGALVLSSLLPTTEVVRGPDGTSLLVAVDRSLLPYQAGLLLLVLGAVVGALAGRRRAVRRLR